MTKSKLEKKTEDKPKKAAKKETAKKAEKVDVKSLEGTAGDIAWLIGVTTPNITNLVQAGTMKRQENGKFNFVDCVSSYCRALRERKAGSIKTSIEEETAIWKLQNIKVKNRDWRMQRDRMVATEILRVLADSMGEIRELAKLNPALCDEIDVIIGRIGRIDVEGISLAVEGDDEEDEE